MYMTIRELADAADVFSHSAIASLNNLEMMVYNYVIKIVTK